ncbi:hypothetical protein OG824_27655 [Streptomyces prunicolor]|uniref:hypothetical protein n=1 Tax=Streptomyces prunicolor TaxID=67348 RepID=UPI00225625DF|nr:hypothetical protein [Streptomyces prunicolor]MCX5238981.1 hypothetical protein [Streptomyces prunicolor]
MAADPQEAAERTAAAMAYVCVHLEQVRDDLRTGPGGDEGPLDRLLAAVGNGRDLTVPLDLMHARLQSDGDAAGIYGRINNGTATRNLRPAGVDGAGHTGAAETVYLCPAARCARVWWPQAATPIPQCEISGETLCRERL